MKNVQVSVVIPAYNSEKTIIRAITSILNGSLIPHEILIYDDCSTDNTIEVIENNFATHGLVSIFHGQKNMGAGHARNELMAKALGNYIAFLDADDWWYPDKLEKQVQQIMLKNCDIVTSGYDIYDINDRLLGKRTPIQKINNMTMHLTNWLPTSMTVFRKDLISAQEMPLIRRRQDYGFWLKIFNNNTGLKCCVIDKPLGGYQRRLDSLSASKFANLGFNYRLFRKFLQYNIVSSVILVFLNSIIRIMRK